MEKEGNELATLSLPADLELVACDAQADGPFIRVLTRANFYDIVSRTIGWNEDRAQRELHDPDRYTMVRHAGQTIGFFALRDDGDALYLQTIQLVASARGQGIGTALLRHIASVARARHLPRLRLRAFRDSRAYALYQRHGFRVVDGATSHVLMEKDLHATPEDEHTPYL